MEFLCRWSLACWWKYCVFLSPSRNHLSLDFWNQLIPLDKWVHYILKSVGFPGVWAEPNQLVGEHVGCQDVLFPKSFSEGPGFWSGVFWNQKMRYGHFQWHQGPLHPHCSKFQWWEAIRLMLSPSLMSSKWDASMAICDFMTMKQDRVMIWTPSEENFSISMDEFNSTLHTLHDQGAFVDERSQKRSASRWT